MKGYFLWDRRELECCTEWASQMGRVLASLGSVGVVGLAAAGSVEVGEVGIDCKCHFVAPGQYILRSRSRLFY